MQYLWAEQVLTDQGWQEDVTITIDPMGKISSIAAGQDNKAQCYSVLVPAMANLHSHVFQRAMAGMTERRGPEKKDSFWTWRALMYRFVEHLTPEDIEVIAAFAQMEMLQAGYASVAEFHYLHHQANGQPYDNRAELALRIAAAAQKTGIGLTLLPVLYQQADCAGTALSSRQQRFGNDFDQWIDIIEAVRGFAGSMPKDYCVGFAPHSLRAVSRPSMLEIGRLNHSDPIHIHIAEQIAEIDEVKAHYGHRPVDILFELADVNKKWCLVHATHMTAGEITKLAESGAVAGLCPVTEANLGDGIFNGKDYFSQKGQFGVGTDSNIRISLSEELRQLEYSQRLQERARAVLAPANHSNGRSLFDHAARGGAQGSGRQAGCIAVGYYADILALDSRSIPAGRLKGDTILDYFIFAGDDRLVSDVWSAGRHQVIDGSHILQEEITSAYQVVLQKLQDRI